MSPWQQNLSELDNAYERYSAENEADAEEPQAEIELVAEMTTTKIVKKQKGVLSKKDMLILLHLRQVLQAHREDEEQQKRSQTITQLEVAKFIPKPNSLANHLYTILLPTGKNGMHINDIIVRVERAGYVFNSLYHKYAQVHSSLRRNGYMIVRVKPGTFRLRDGFLNEQPIEKTQTGSSHIVKDDKIPNLIDMVNHVIAECKGTKLTPLNIWYMLNQMGVYCSYEYLRSKIKEKNIVLSGRASRPLRTR